MDRPEYSWVVKSFSDKFKQKAFEIPHEADKSLASYINDIVDAGWFVSHVIPHGDGKKYTIIAFKEDKPHDRRKESTRKTQD